MADKKTVIKKTTTKDGTITTKVKPDKEMNFTLSLAFLVADSAKQEEGEPVVHPFFWRQVALGGKFLVGVLSLPIFLLGLVITGFRATRTTRVPIEVVEPTE